MNNNTFHIKELYSKPLIALLIVVNFFYYISAAYSTNSNDGSSLAAVMAVVKNGSYIIDDFADLTYNVDVSKYKGHYFSDRPPGTATLAVPLFVMGIYVARKIFKGNKKLPVVFTLFLPVIMGTLSVFLIFYISRFFNFSYWPSFFGSFFYAFGTFVWQKSTLLYTHIPALFLALLAVSMALNCKDIKEDKFKFLIIGFLCGTFPLFEYHSVLMSVVITVYLLTIKRPFFENIKKNKVLILIYALVAIIGVMPLLIYNYTYFDSPFTTSYSHKLHFTFYSNMTNIFSGSMLSGLRDYLFRFDRLFKSGNESPGLFVMSSFLLFSIPGFFKLYKIERNKMLLLLMLFLVPTLFLAFHPTPLSRYVSTYIPFLAIPGICILDVLWKKDVIINKFLIGLYVFLGMFSIWVVFYNTNRFYGHSPSLPFVFFHYELASWFAFCAPLFLISYAFSFFLVKKVHAR